MNKPVRAGAVPDVNEILTRRKRFYAQASVDDDYLVCFDERGTAEAATDDPDIAVITPELYLHAAGGALSIAYNQAVLEEADGSTAVRDSFESRAGALMPDLIKAGVKPGVHSDVNSEKGSKIHNDPAGTVGCGYAEARAAISLSIAGHISDITNEAAVLRPELFIDPEAYELARAIGAAHGRLAERPGFLAGGRRVVLSAARNGAKMMLMTGPHTGRNGIINLVPGTTFDSNAAAHGGLEAYNQDSWAVQEVNRRLQAGHPSDENTQQIAELIDALGTMRSLGVDEIVVRRS